MKSFTYPLFYPAGESGWTVDVPLQTPYASRPQVTRLELVHDGIIFRPEHVRSRAAELHIETLSEGIAIAKGDGNSKDFDKGCNYTGKSEAEAGLAPKNLDIGPTVTKTIKKQIFNFTKGASFCLRFISLNKVQTKFLY